MVPAGYDPLAMPPALAARGFSLRTETGDDFAFLETLYISVRWDELAVLDWSVEQKIAFARQQFSYQVTHYAAHYGGTDFGILLHHGDPVGRWYIFRGRADVRVVDVSLLPQYRGQGIATGLFDALLAEAGRDGKTVGIHVEKFNPARNLYRRLGFRDAGESGPYLFLRWSPQPPDTVEEK